MDITYERALKLAYFTFVAYVDYHEWAETHHATADRSERVGIELNLAERRERALGKCELISEMFGKNTYDVYCDLEDMWYSDDARRA